MGQLIIVLTSDLVIHDKVASDVRFRFVFKFMLDHLVRDVSQGGGIEDVG